MVVRSSVRVVPSALASERPLRLLSKSGEPVGQVLDLLRRPLLKLARTSLPPINRVGRHVPIVRHIQGSHARALSRFTTSRPVNSPLECRRARPSLSLPPARALPPPPMDALWCRRAPAFWCPRNGCVTLFGLLVSSAPCPAGGRRKDDERDRSETQVTRFLYTKKQMKTRFSLGNLRFLYGNFRTRTERKAPLFPRSVASII